jgi:hypothetical protein
MSDLTTNIAELTREVDKRECDLLITYDDGEWAAEVWRMGPRYTEELVLSVTRECDMNSVIVAALHGLSEITDGLTT